LKFLRLLKILSKKVQYNFLYLLLVNHLLVDSLIALRPERLATPTLRRVDDDVMMTWHASSNDDVTIYGVVCR